MDFFGNKFIFDFKHKNLHSFDFLTAFILFLQKIPDFIYRFHHHCSIEMIGDTTVDMQITDRLFPITARAVQVYMKRHVAKANVKEIRVHDLRHSHVAYLINQGVEPLLIKERLGHRDIKITLNTYGHLYPNRQKAVAMMLNESAKKVG